MVVRFTTKRRRKAVSEARQSWFDVTKKRYSHRVIETITGEKPRKMYAKFLVKYPYVNIIVVLLMFIWAAVIGFVPQLGAQDLPNFSQPTKGFEPRDTVLSNNKNAYDNLKKAYDAKILFSSPQKNTGGRRKRSPPSVPLQNLENSCIYLTNIVGDVEGNKIIYEEKTNGDLFDANKLKSLCQLQNQIMRSNEFFKSNVARGIQNLPCPSHSIANYAAALANRTSCMHLTQSDVNRFKLRLMHCSSSYKDGLLESCLNDPTFCSRLPHNCSKHTRILFNSFKYLTDSTFASEPTRLKLTLVSERLYSPFDNTLYKSVYEANLKNLDERTEGQVQVAAFEFYNLKFQIFEKKLFVEGALLSSAILIVFILIILYSGSVFIGLMTFFCIVIAAVLAYFFYGIVFRLSFFPFLNVLTLVFLVGIGADDAFVYMGAWSEAKAAMPYKSDESFDDAMIRWTAYSIKHALVAMFVTSFTTAAAFFAGSSSSIIAIRCFGIYAGTSILMNYFMMVAWFPVAVVISEKHLSRCMNRIAPSWFSYPPGEPTSNVSGSSCSKIKSFAARISQDIFSKVLPAVVMHLRYFLVIFFAVLGVGGLLVLFVSPKLRLPITKDFQMFSDSSSIEQFPLHYKSKFNVESFNMPIFFIFGVNNGNTASTTNPDDFGYLKLQEKFTVTSPEEQLWLKHFCKTLQNSSFVSGNVAACSDILTMLEALTIPCNASTNAISCCGHTLPVTQETAELCIRSYFNSSKHPSRSRGFNGFLFNRDGHIRAILIVAGSRYQFTEAFDTANDFYNEIKAWFDSMKANAPESFRSCFWHSYLDFYDLQKGLAAGTPVSLGISVLIAFCVVLLTTCNILLSIYTVVSILFVISVTVGTLVLAGWRLNIMESIIFSVAAGLAVDFTLHYGVAYRTAVDKTCRINRVRYSFTHIGAAVTMGAITTFISGLVMAPSSVLVYIQLSHFLMALMTFSWLYATFFFMPLCSIIGPVNDFCQLNLCSLLSNKGQKSVAQSKDMVGKQQEMENVSETVT
eukprot:gene6517-11981_t